MDELTYMTALADEVRNNTNPRLKTIVQWCERLNASTRACGNDQLLQRNQAAVTAGALLLDICYMEVARVEVPPHVSHSAYVRDDPYLLRYTIAADFDQQMISIQPDVIDALTNKVQDFWVFEPLTLSMRERESEAQTLKSDTLSHH